MPLDVLAVGQHAERHADAALASDRYGDRRVLDAPVGSEVQAGASAVRAGLGLVQQPHAFGRRHVSDGFGRRSELKPENLLHHRRRSRSDPRGVAFAVGIGQPHAELRAGHLPDIFVLAVNDLNQKTRCFRRGNTPNSVEGILVALLCFRREGCQVFTKPNLREICIRFALLPHDSTVVRFFRQPRPHEFSGLLF